MMRCPVCSHYDFDQVQAARPDILMIRIAPVMLSSSKQANTRGSSIIMNIHGERTERILHFAAVL